MSEHDNTSPLLPPDERHDAGTYQMLWDCKFCGTEKLLGITHRHCPNCGAAQDPVWRYFPSEAGMIALEDHEYVGVDKMCPACSQPNSAASTYCGECGADLATGEAVVTYGERELGTGIAATDTQRDVVKDQFEAEMARVEATEPAPKVFMGLSKKQLIIVGIVVLLAACVIGGIYAATYRKNTKGVITALLWERVVEIERFNQHTDAGWDNTVPPDAYNMSCQRKQSGTRRVAAGSHEECSDVDQGDGSFRRQCRTVTDYRSEPVYDDWCTYYVDRWRTYREVKSDGVANVPAPTWPVVTLATGSGTRNYGKERQGDKHETYKIVIREANGKEHTCNFDEQTTWAAYAVEMTMSFQVSIQGNIDCDTLKRSKTLASF